LRTGGEWDRRRFRRRDKRIDRGSYIGRQNEEYSEGKREKYNEA
jgi:hypothetical protein